MSENPNTQATPGTSVAGTLADPVILVEPVEAQAEELSAKSLSIASQLAAGRKHRRGRRTHPPGSVRFARLAICRWCRAPQCPCPRP